MRAFTYSRQEDAADILRAFSAGASQTATEADAQFLAGGTTLVDLMRLNVMRPQSVIDINPLSATELGKIQFGPQGLKLGALAHMAEAADHKDIRATYPV